MNHPAERDIEREAFEKWAKESLPEYCNPRAPTWEIVEANVRAEAWAAWQARAAQATAEPVADPRLEDLRYIVERLARKLAKADPNSGEPSGALIYLRRVGLTGSPLRTAPDRAPGALDRFLAAAAEAKITHLAIPVDPDRAPSADSAADARDAVLEEAAKVCGDLWGYRGTNDHHKYMADLCAMKIRALKSQPIAAMQAQQKEE